MNWASARGSNRCIGFIVEAPDAGLNCPLVAESVPLAMSVPLSEAFIRLEKEAHRAEPRTYSIRHPSCTAHSAVILARTALHGHGWPDSPASRRCHPASNRTSKRTFQVSALPVDILSHEAPQGGALRLVLPVGGRIH